MKRGCGPAAVLRGASATLFVLALLLCGCAGSARRCSGALQPINAPAASATRDGRDDER
jgi:hypothetical protein